MPRIVIFLDLDDTILQTAPKCPPAEPVAPAAVDRAGRALSFMTRAQQRLLAFWLERGTVIPVTGRTDEALARVTLKFESWRITHHGAVIRQPDGRLPAWWHDEIRPLLVAAQPLLWEYAASLERDAATEGYRVRSHSVDEWLTYISVKANADDVVLTELRTRLLPSVCRRNWRCTTMGTIWRSPFGAYRSTMPCGGWRWNWNRRVPSSPSAPATA